MSEKIIFHTKKKKSLLKKRNKSTKGAYKMAVTKYITTSNNPDYAEGQYALDKKTKTVFTKKTKEGQPYRTQNKQLIRKYLKKKKQNKAQNK